VYTSTKDDWSRLPLPSTGMSVPPSCTKRYADVMLNTPQADPSNDTRINTSFRVISPVRNLRCIAGGYAIVSWPLVRSVPSYNTSACASPSTKRHNKSSLQNHPQTPCPPPTRYSIPLRPPALPPSFSSSSSSSSSSSFPSSSFSSSSFSSSSCYASSNFLVSQSILDPLLHFI